MRFGWMFLVALLLVCSYGQLAQGVGSGFQGYLIAAILAAVLVWYEWPTKEGETK